MSARIGRSGTFGSTLKWLVLVALAWSQLAFALHQSHEHAGDRHATCAVCKHFDRDDAILDVEIQSGATDTTAILNPVNAEIPSPAESCSHYRARASP
jgi:hypothetical protein